MDDLLSIVIPSYNEEDNVGLAAKKILSLMSYEKIPCEIIFVSDGSKDNTYRNILEEAKKDSRVRGIEFSRNFGKEAAILAGLRKGTGSCFVVMDCDLQHPPKTVVEMYRKWQEGYKIVEGIKNSRGKESFLYKKCSQIFYGILTNLTGFNLKNTSDFKLIDRKVAQILCELPERKTFFRALSFWVGFKSCQVRYDVAERASGESKWSVVSLIQYAITNIISFSSKPLNIVTYLGAFSVIAGFTLGIWAFISWVTGHIVSGFTGVILLLLLIGGCILLGLGVIGQYIAAIYLEVKHRPRYIVQYNSNDGQKADTNGK